MKFSKAECIIIFGLLNDKMVQIESQKANKERNVDAEWIIAGAY